MAARPEVPAAWVRRIADVLEALPDCERVDAWVGVQWKVGRTTVAHAFGGEDGLIRITFHAEPDEVMAFQHLGPPYFRAGYGRDVVGLVIDERTEWTELGELLTDAYCLRAPEHLASRVPRPPAAT